MFLAIIYEEDSGFTEIGINYYARSSGETQIIDLRDQWNHRESLDEWYSSTQREEKTRGE